jgi:hypothetical protein
MGWAQPLQVCPGDSGIAYIYLPRNLTKGIFSKESEKTNTYFLGPVKHSRFVK